MLRRLASHLPFPVRQSLRAWKYRWQQASGRFQSDEPEFHRLSEWVKPGDWVLDVGANVGQYTLRFSELVGEQGHVIAFEPIAETAEILAALARRATYRNISVLSLAVSESAGDVSFRVPNGATGLPNYFQARISADGDRTVPCIPLDDMPFSNRIALVKIDVEQHEVQVIRGMQKLIERDHPILIIEGHEGIYQEFLSAHGYRMLEKPSGSPNLVFTQ